MIIYINIKTKAYGVETVDELDSKDYPKREDFREVIRTSCAVNNGYASSRSTKEWREK